MTDSLFLLPALNGLCLAIMLPLLGCYLRLRREWLAAIAYPHVAAAGALGALALGAPLLPGGIATAVLAAFAKRHGERHWNQNTVYVFLLLAGWALAVLLTANLPMAERLGHALFDGQLYFTGGEHLVVLLAMLAVALGLLRALSRTLLLAQLFPQLLPRSRATGRWQGLAFDLLAAAVLSLATLTLGVMGTFALIFVPAWIAFQTSSSWRRSLFVALASGLVAYVCAFVTAMQFDQPFGPCLAATAVFLALGNAATRRDCIIQHKMIQG